MIFVSKIFNIFKKILKIVFIFEKRQLILLWMLIVIQALIQVMGIFSIMPFLTLATNTDAVIKYAIVQKIIEVIPFLKLDNLVFVAGIGTIFLLVTSSIVNGATDYCKERYAQFTCMRIGTHLLTSYANQPYIFHLNHNSAELVKRIQSDVNMFMRGVLLPFLELISRTINVLLILIVIFVTSPITGGVVFLIFSSFLGLTFMIFRRTLAVGNKERKRLISKRFVTAHQLLIGIKTVIIHECRKYFVSDFYYAYRRIAHLDSSLVFISSTPRYIIEAIAFSSIVLIILVLQANEISLETVLPSMAFFVLAAYRIMPSLQLIYKQITEIQSKRYTVDILSQDLFEVSPHIAKFHSHHKLDLSQIIKLQKSIVVDRVSFAYPNSAKLALNTLSLKIEKSQRIGLVGSSGSGKSTLIDLLIGLLDPSSGKILIDDVELTPERYAQWHHLVGYVAQDIFLTDDTIRRNIAFGVSDRNIAEDRVVAAAKIAQIHDYIKRELPYGYDTLCGERGVRLSGGQRQRIALARALYHQPSVLVFDEATSALDSETERKLIAEIENLPKNLTVIMVAHRLSTVQNCDVIFVLERGGLVAQGTYEQLLDESSTFQKLATNVR